MQVVVVVSDKESNERAISRFNKAVQSSRKLLKVRSERYHSRPESRRHSRAAAVMREHYRGKRAKNKFY